jgi:hypothetical protein
MAKETKPSIYQDRGTIGSAKELDEYGVWVKSEPQILDSGGAEPGGDLSLEDLDKLPDFSIDADDSSGSGTDDTDFSIPEDGFNLDDFDIGMEPDGTDESDAGPAEAADDFSIDEDTFSLDDGDLDLSFTEDDTPPELSQESPREDEAPEDEASREQSSEEDNDGDFTDMSLEDLLGGVADEIPDEQNPAEDPGGEPETDMSTQLLMKIAGELSSIRKELSALKQEFSIARGSLETEHGESHGFFDDASDDDKIALTGDELNNIISTADFTEETGADATGEDALSIHEDFSPEADTPDTGTEVELSLPGETEDPAGALLSEDVLSAFPEIPADLLTETLTEPLTETLTEPLAEAEEEGLSLIEEAAEGEPELPEISLDDAEVLLASGPDILEDAETPEDSAFPDISLELSPEGGGIDIGDFEEESLDLSGAVIDEPDLGAEIQENPLVEPADILLEDDADILFPETAGEVSAETLEEPVEIAGEPIDILEEPVEIAGESIDILEEPGEIVEEPVLEIEDETEISRAEESAAEIPAVRAGDSHGEDLEQIIPEGFLVEELDDDGEAGFGGAGLDTLDEGVSLDEIPEDILPEEDEPGPAENTEEPEAPGLPGNFKKELKQVLSYMDQLLESLPEEKIEEFAQSEYFDTYKKLFKELGLA